MKSGIEALDKPITATIEDKDSSGKVVRTRTFLVRKNRLWFTE